MQRQYKKYILLFWCHGWTISVIMVVSLFIPISFIHFLYWISVLKAVYGAFALQNVSFSCNVFKKKII